MIENYLVNKTKIIDTIKLLIYKKQKELYKKIDFDNDNIYSDPLLFSYFNASDNDRLFCKELLEEILQGYFTYKENLKLDYSFNKNEIAYIPQIGYFRKGEEKPYEKILKRDKFEIVKEVHPTQEKYFFEFYRGHIVNQNPEYKSVWKIHSEELFNAIDIIKEYLPVFYEQLIFANKKIYLHNNYKILNFTTIETLGMLYFYVIGNNNLIYFIEELIHQGSHNYFYYIIHNKNNYFKIDVENLVMRDFTKQKWDYRTIYGAFHGLFTIMQRVECFDKLLVKNVFSGREKHELLGRLTDQFSRFNTGLELLNFNEVYTEKGMKLYDELSTNCEVVLKKYIKLKDLFDLSNRDLDFRYDDFCKLNSFEDFLEMDKNGQFNFDI